MKFFFSLITILYSFSFLAQNSKTEVLILSTLHKNHINNPNYTYEHLDSIVHSFNADVLAVEIRPEDLNQHKDYISKYYPLEMHKYLHTDSNKKYYGFDWFGEDIKGKLLSDDYFNNVNVMRVLQKKLSQDEIVKKQLTVLNPVKEEISKLVKNASPNEMINGTYDLLSNVYYNQMKIVLENTPYYGIYEFSLKRDQEIAKNICEIIRENPNKRILVLLGADHRAFTINYLESQTDIKYMMVNNLD